MGLRVNIRTKLILTILPLALLPIFMFAFVAYRHAKEITSMIISQKGQALQYTASSSMDRLDSFLKSNLENVEGLTRRYEMIDVLADDADGRIYEILTRSKNIYGIYSSLICFNAQGKIIAATDKALIGTELPDDYGFRNALQGKSIITDVSYLLWPRGSFVTISCPIKSSAAQELTGKEDIGVLSVYIDLEAAYRIIESITIDDKPIRPAAYPFLIDTIGSILWAPDVAIGAHSLISSDMLKAGLKSVSNVLQGETGYTIETKQGKAILVGYASSRRITSFQNIGWSILVTQELDEAIEPVLALQRFVLFIGVLEVLIVIIAAIFFSRRITRPVIDLSIAAKKIAEGNEAIITSKSDDEVGELADALSQMLARLNESRKTLESYAESLRVRGLELEASKKELEQKVREMEKFHSFVVDREMRMTELKEELRRLKEAQSKSTS